MRGGHLLSESPRESGILACYLSFMLTCVCTISTMMHVTFVIIKDSAIVWEDVDLDGDDHLEDLFNKCPFSPTQPNIEARCVHGHLISGQGQNVGGDDDDQLDGTVDNHT